MMIMDDGKGTFQEEKAVGGIVEFLKKVILKKNKVLKISKRELIQKE